MHEPAHVWESLLDTDVTALPEACGRKLARANEVRPLATNASAWLEMNTRIVLAGGVRAKGGGESVLRTCC